MNWLLTLFLSFCSHLCFLEASHLLLEAQPQIINPVLTKNLILRCSVKESDVGYQNVPLYLNQQSTLLNKLMPTNYTYTTYYTTTGTTDRTTAWQPATTTAQGVAEVAHVTSIVISRLEKQSGQLEILADVTPFQSAAVAASFAGHASAEGNSQHSPVAGEKGYLQVTWDFPDDGQAGDFICEVFALNFLNHPVNLQSTVTVISREPTISDLAKYIASHEKLLEEMNAPRFQKGNGACRSSGSDVAYFHPSFNKVPTVFTSFTALLLNSFNTGMDFHVTVNSVNHTLFEYSCSTGSYGVATFDWLAFEN